MTRSRETMEGASVVVIMRGTVLGLGSTEAEREELPEDFSCLVLLR